MWDNPRQMNLAALLVALTAVALLSWGAIAWSIRQPVFALRQVVIEGALKRVNPAHLEAVIREELRGTFFTVDLLEARASLQRVPWIKSAALRRQWPNGLRISLTEHEPLARWTEGALIDAQGEVFSAEYAGELPQLAGPDGSAALVAARLREYGAVLSARSLAISELRLSRRGGWQLRTGGAAPLAIELGRTEPGERLARFVAYYARTVGALARAGSRTDYVDLRYRNGFAVRVPGLTEKRKTG